VLIYEEKALTTLYTQDEAKLICSTHSKFHVSEFFLHSHNIAHFNVLGAS